jgi:hypothetical protein
VLASEGYRTVALVTNPYLVRNKHGIFRGFEEPGITAAHCTGKCSLGLGFFAYPGERRSICKKANWHDRAESDIKNWNRENEDIAAALGAGEKQELGLEQQERLRAIGYIE